MMEPIILDGVLSEQEMARIEALMTSPGCLWQFSPDVNWGYASSGHAREVRDQVIEDPSSVTSFQMIHVFKQQGQDTATITPLARKIVLAAGFDIAQVIRFKSNLLTQNPSVGNRFHLPHIDGPAPHFALLYYVNESDGDTVFFNERYANGVERVEATISQRVTPKRGRAVVFNGMQFHASSHPIQSRYRIALNFNFIPGAKNV